MTDDLQMPDVLWQQMLTEGHVAGAPLGVDVFYVAGDEASADRLAAELRGEGWATDVEPVTERRLLRRRTTWWLQASKVVPGFEPAMLEQIMDDAARRAERHGVDLDGWGAGGPGTADAPQ